MPRPGPVCDVCGGNDVPPQPADVVVLRQLIGPQAKGLAHPSCLINLQSGGGA